MAAGGRQNDALSLCAIAIAIVTCAACVHAAGSPQGDGQLAPKFNTSDTPDGAHAHHPDHHHGHKSLYPMVPVDWVTLGLTLLVAFIASGAGIGGGGILLPIFVLIAGFKVHQAVALSNVTVLGSSFGNAILNIGKRHPSHDGPLIDWDLILIMEPMTIVGAVVGAYLQALLPGWVTASLLTLVLTLISRALLIKGISLYRRESRAMIDAPSSSGLAQPLLLTAATKAVATAAGRDSSDSGGGGGGGGGVPSSATLRTPVPLSLPGAHAHTHRRHGLGDPEDGGMSSSTELDTETLSWREGVQTPGRSGSGTDGTGADADAEDETTCEDDGWTEDGFSPFDADDDADAYIKMMHQEATQVPPLKLLTLVFLTAWMAGSDTAKGYLPCGSLPYWGVVASNGATCLLVTLVMQSHLLAKAALRRRMGRPPHAGAIRWTCANARLYPLLCSSAGIVAGMFGVGGGVVKGPLMLELGVQPEVASASSATMILFTTAAASVCNCFVLSIPVARGANWFLAGGGRRMDEEEATAAAAERIAAAAEDGTSLPVRLATDVVRFLYGGTGRREPADGGVVSASLLNAKPAVGGIGVEPRGGGVLRVLFTVASDAVADTVVRWRHELRRCVDSTAVFDVLSDREEAQHQALWPAFLAAKVAGKRAQFHRARLVVDGERVPAPAC
ncbi:hypothetical protein FOA52_015625 [Chlamydomonas sp. UWO 241]|nr:hypothetical protein FOA52_015625 [Chlamydomonas sp. UWO 241]